MRKRPKLVIAAAASALILASLSFYGYYQSKDYLRGPEISIYEPRSGSVFKKPLVNIKGRASRVAFISLNDRQIFVDEAGNFDEKLLLAEGYNIIKVSGKDRFGKTATKLIEAVFSLATTSPPSPDQDEEQKRQNS